MKLGTFIKLPDGREATVVFNGLTGVGIVFGRRVLDPDDYKGTYGDLFSIIYPKHLRPTLVEPEAMLRDESLTKVLGMPCVGTEFEILETLGESENV